jgi:3',5'-cyclic AMP phosphodiesterase CpdA
MRIAFVTDVHFGPATRWNGKLRKLSHHAGPLLTACIESFNRDLRPDLLVNLGDVIEDASVEADLRAYGEFTRILSAAACPLLHVPGNHDQVNLSDDALRRLWGHSGELFYSRDVGSLHFVVLRARHQRNAEGREVNITIADDQLAWIEADLASTERDVVVCVHHPLGEMDLTGNRWFEGRDDVCLVKNRAEVRALFERSGKVRAVFNGHVHWNHLSVIEGIPYVTLQSLTENLDEDAPGRPAQATAVADIDDACVRVWVRGEEPYRAEFPRPRR